MSSTTLLTGAVGAVLLIVAPIAILVARVTLARYRRAVARLMSASAAGAPEIAVSDVRAARKLAARNEMDAAVLAASIRRGRWELAGVHAVAGTLAALTMTATLFIASKKEFLPLRTAVTTLIHAWPVVLTVILIAAASRRAVAVCWGVYFAACVLVGIAVALLSPTSGPLDPLVMWLTMALPPTLLVWAALNRRVRAIGPLVLLVLTLCFIGGNLALAWVAENVHRVAAIGARAGLGATGTVTAFALLGVAAMVPVAIVLLRIIRSAYTNKLISDQSIVLDAVWLMFCFWHAAQLTFEAGPAGFALGLAAPFAAYRVAAALGTRALRRRSTRKSAAPRLLFLRVFALGDKSVELWTTLGKAFRNTGSIRMIAGPDLAATAIEPHELLDFVTGQLATRFIDDGPALERAIAAIDDDPDLDGRYRVNDFFCRDHVWRATFTRLLADSDAVLMDVRSFSSERSGAKFELAQLARAADMARVVLLVDRTTDRALLLRTLAMALPGEARDANQPRILELEDTDVMACASLTAALSLALAGEVSL
jgi:hypothetical protein